MYEEMRKYLVIYKEAVSHKWLCNCSIPNFLIYELRKIASSFLSVQTARSRKVCKCWTALSWQQLEINSAVKFPILILASIFYVAMKICTAIRYIEPFWKNIVSKSTCAKIRKLRVVPYAFQDPPFCSITIEYSTSVLRSYICRLESPYILHMTTSLLQGPVFEDCKKDSVL